MSRPRLGLLPSFHGRNVIALVKRAGWLGILFVHLGAIRSAALSVFTASAGPIPPDSGLRLLALLAAAIFFALKFADVPWLRLNRSWRSAIASLVIVALLHVNAVERLTAGERVSSPSPLSAVLFVAVLVDVEAARRWSVRLWNAIARVYSSHVQHYSYLFDTFGASWPEAVTPPHLWLTRSLLTPRPPPIL